MSARVGIEFSKVWAAITDMPLPEGELPVNCTLKVPGVKYELKASWIQLMAPKTGCRMYIARQKKVRQIDLSGFGAGLIGTIKATKKNGMVQAHVDLSDERALDHITMLLFAMTTIESAEKVRNAPFVASSKKKVAETEKKPDAKAGNFDKLDREAASERANRLFLFSKTRGTKVSPETMAKLYAQGADRSLFVEGWEALVEPGDAVATEIESDEDEDSIEA